MGFEITAPLFHDFVRLNGKWLATKPAIIADDETLDWATLDKRSSQVAHGLRSLGKGSAIAIIMDNCAAYVEILYGILKAGAIIVPLNVSVDEAGLLRMVQDSGARAIFMTPKQWQRFASKDMPDGTQIFLVGDDAPATQRYEAWRDKQSAQHPSWEIGETDPCNIIYSSGTTGVPKGIKHAHRRRVQSMYELSLAHRYHNAAISICSIGLYSNIAWASLFCALIVGGTCVVQSGFDPERWLSAIEKHNVTHTFMAPIMFQRVLESSDFSPARVKSLEAVISGGAPLHESLKRRIGDEFDCALMELYGLTEGFMTTLDPEDAEGRIASVGKPVRGNDYILVDDADQPLEWGATGEICVRSVHWMTEYHNRPEATEEIRYIDPAGTVWLRTGDIGRTDEAGFLYITDRKKDMIVSGGQNIYPIDIETVMLTHPSVSEVAVVGEPHSKWGETPIAFVVLSPGGSEVSPTDIADWTNKHVGKRQRIARVELRTDLPRNPNGKILKRALRDQVRGEV